MYINNSWNYSNEFKKNDSEHPNYFTKRWLDVGIHCNYQYVPKTSCFIALQLITERIFDYSNKKFSQACCKSKCTLVVLYNHCVIMQGNNLMCAWYIFHNYHTTLVAITTHYDFWKLCNLSRNYTANYVWHQTCWRINVQLGNHNAKKFKQYHHLYFGLATNYIKINNQNVLYIKVTRIYIYTYKHKEGCKINHIKISSK